MGVAEMALGGKARGWARGVTGGEPVIMPEIEELAAAQKARGQHITVETAATVFKPMAMDRRACLRNWRIRRRTSGREVVSRARTSDADHIRVIQQFIDSAEDFQLKFVVSSKRIWRKSMRS